MKRHRLFAAAATGSVLVFLAGGAFAQTCPPECVLPGGKDKKKECFTEFDVTGSEAATVKYKKKGKKTTVTCTDGTACDTDSTPGVCGFGLSACVNNQDGRFSQCSSSPLSVTSVKVKGSAELQAAVDAIGLPTDASTCSASVSVLVPTKTKKGKEKKGSKKLSVTTKGTKGKDKDKIVLTCAPGENNNGGNGRCPANSAGGPNIITLTVGNGADLDTGWTGLSHNQGVTVGSSVSVCLQDCDLDTNPVCSGTGPTGGSGKLNGRYFGSPLPLIAGDVPTCVLNEFRQDIRMDKLDLVTGELDMTVLLTSRVHQGLDTNSPCPVCSARNAQVGSSGRCIGGPDDGKSCTVGGITPFGPTSEDCRPDPQDNIGNLEINLPLSTDSGTLSGTGFQCLPPPSGSGGRCPCENQLKPNDCGTGCNESTCPSGLEPGIDQTCCRDNRGGKSACFVGGQDITRTGVRATPYTDPQALTGAWPDATYPKTALGGALATPFCIPATRENLVNSVAGLPGAGALILPGPMVIDKEE
jgi:hypothetical protein